MIHPARTRRRPAATLICLALPAAGAAHGGPPQPPAPQGGCEPALVVADPHTVYGDGYQFGEVTHTFAVSNQGTRPVAVTGTVAVTGDGELTVRPRRLGPGESGTVEVRQPLGGRLGRAAFRYALLTDEPCVDRYRFSLSGFVQSAFDPEQPAFELGTVDRHRGAAVETELASREVDRLEVVAISGAPEWLSVEITGRAGVAGEAVVLRATVAPGAPLGRHSGRLEVRTNVPHQPHTAIAYRAAVFGDVVPATLPVDLGLARVGEELAGEVTLRSRSGSPIVVERVEDPSGAVTTELAHCPGEPPGCALLRLRHQAIAETALDGRVLVHLAAGGEPLPIDYRGWVVPAGTQIRDLGEISAPEGGAAGVAGTGSALVAAAERSTAAEDRQGAPAPAGGPAAPGGGAGPPTVHWTVVDETGIYGYLVYRAERREGPFRRVDDGIVKVPHDDGADRHSYTWVDRTAEPCTTYHYYLDLVGFGGLKQRFSGVASKSVPCD